ncbi:MULTISPECIES: HyaD/HybD family hydrogenase maturation endopeptidase [unclassified Bradyrhizobium]|uniref:HyaD/HybD family hydrogenase maturation endopeptidase n=1 Tax=unclassified Bradyrhizobium TaxID=2631580 RepID=UPI001CD1D11E|nr:MULTISPECIES: HyaD/HybD family hydrogenase maturation endopeptidase [unclassified Bradyrhizobium]MCA1384296.1 HyaD/HybD family hydrogenase maturation endopeptidase [Bradyrhizobium sp. BRP05]MCA1393619.1 HyaD/HybD family hydrogenase maturation endopeptidase [Bradyrhizobium sp. IC3123]MCA1421038.1 HyaD/HybD family hydrogenase maturation endopeptidase [Bradyrhizobium sp. BRP23]MCA1430764.1 HyaD/HybD family hydrogenase maturation endopeptidase [Bradyrhizobium sp. NBAIM16]MCA1436268.1 HyaD/HybD 
MLNPETKKRILVLGIGNILWADEGFGVRVVEEFHRRYAIDDNVTVLDGGTQGLYLISFLEQADCLIVFDAIDYGLLPGQLKLVRDDEVPKFTAAKKVSLHQTGFQEVLSAADLLGRRPRELALIGCQPLDLEHWGGPLTAPVRFQIAPAIELACKLLAQWDSPAKPRTAPLPASERLLANNIDHANYEMRTQPI